MSPALRLATQADAAACQAIYAPIVAHTVISFELEPPTVAEMAQRIEKYLAHAPWLVAEQAGQVLGYAYASQHRERWAYQWAVEVSVYVHEAARRRGVGRALYTALFGALRAQGFYNAYAGIVLPNPASVAVHEAVGFAPVGIYRQIGYKRGAWHDVGWWHLALQPLPTNPLPPRPLAEVLTTPAWGAALQIGAELFKG